jgi:iron complex transport system ATP-binding protein
VRAGYGKVEVLHGVSLGVPAGSVVALLGPNGAGKTTLFRTLLGLIPALGGRVLVDGKDLAAMSRPAVAREVAYVPQASTAGFDFTLLETVEMGRSAHLGAIARPRPRDRELAAAALERLGIGALADRALATVSGGERQLALIARALATEARALVMDEPTANLDYGNQSRVLDEIARLRDTGIAVLLCTHEPGHAFQVADRALLLDRGQVLAQGAAAEILTAPNLSRLYGVTVQVTEVETPSGRRRVCIPAPVP